MESQITLYHPQLNTKSSSLLKRLAGRLRGRRFLRDPSNLRYMCLIRKQNTEHNSKKLYTPGIDLIRPSRKNIAKHAKTIKDLNGPQALNHPQVLTTLKNARQQIIIAEGLLLRGKWISITR